MNQICFTKVNPITRSGVGSNRRYGQLACAVDIIFNILCIHINYFSGPDITSVNNGTETDLYYDTNLLTLTVAMSESTESGKGNVSTQACIPSLRNEISQKPKIIVPQMKNASTSTDDLDQTWGYITIPALRTEQKKALFGTSTEILDLLLFMIQDDLKEPKKKSKLDKLGVCLMKLKLNISDEAIAAIFGIHRQTVSRWFKETLLLLAEASKGGVVWLPKYMIQDRMPSSFKALFPDARCLLDCTEVFIQTPKLQEHNILCYSSYKSHLTMKFLVVAAPSGEVMYLSPCYGGRATGN